MPMPKGNGYSIKKTAVKGIQYFLIGGLTAVIEYLAGIPTSVGFAVYQSLLIAVLGAVLNIIKNLDK